MTAGWATKWISLSPGYSTVGLEVPSFYPVLGYYPVTGYGGYTPSNKLLIKNVGKNLSGQSKHIQFKIGTYNRNESFKLFKFALYYRMKKPRA
jgi:hypothetical protein